MVLARQPSLESARCRANQIKQAGWKMSDELLAKWRKHAVAIDEPRTSFGVPVHVFLGEAVEAAGFAQNYWDNQKDPNGRVVRPGLESVNKPGRIRLSPDIVQELDELQQAAHRAQFHYKMAVDPPGLQLMDLSEQVLGELSAVLEYFYDDGETTVEDAQLQVLATQHSTPTSHDAMALALDDYAAMADAVSDELDGLANFSLETIGQARSYARQLRERSAPGAQGERVSQALRLRNQIWTLLYDRVSNVRRAAGIVYRAHPEIQRRVTSSYQRAKQAEYRRRQRVEQAARADNP